MWEKILAIKTKAEHDLILAQAKIEVADELLASLDEDAATENHEDSEITETAIPSTNY